MTVHTVVQVNDQANSLSEVAEILLPVWHGDSILFASGIITLLASVFPINGKSRINESLLLMHPRICRRNTDGGNPQ